MRPTRESLAIDAIEDVYGTRWLVAEYRPTAHGFAVALGWPEDATGPAGPATIETPGLIAYLRATRRPRDISLPLGGTTIKQLRRALDLRFSYDAWWQERAADLASLTLEAFSRRHGCSMGAASQRRRALLQAAQSCCATAASG